MFMSVPKSMTSARSSGRKDHDFYANRRHWLNLKIFTSCGGTSRLTQQALLGTAGYSRVICQQTRHQQIHRMESGADEGEAGVAARMAR